MRIYPRSGTPRDVFVDYINHDKIVFKANMGNGPLQDYHWRASAIKGALGGGALVTYDATANRFHKTESIRVENRTATELQSQLIAAWDPNGVAVPFAAESKKSHLVTNLERLRDILGGAPDKGIKPTYLWKLRLGETVVLRHGGTPILANHVRARLLSNVGQSTTEFHNDFAGTDFVIRLGGDQSPKPVLVKQGEWSVAQNITYETVRGRSPEVKITQHGRNSSVTTTFQSRDYEYQRKVLDGVATASAEFVNPTNQRVRVILVVEFEFTDLLFSFDPVAVEFVMEPRSRGTFHTSVNTRGWVGNRKVVRASTREIQTEVVR